MTTESGKSTGRGRNATESGYWTGARIKGASQSGTLAARRDTGLVYYSPRFWRSAVDGLMERPNEWRYVPDELVIRIQPEAVGLRAGEYFEWDGAVFVVGGSS